MIDLHSLKLFPKQVLVFTCLQNKSFENTVRKGEIACNEQFLLFPQCFLPFRRTFFHFHQIQNCRLQTLSVWKSLKLVVRERVIPLLKRQILDSSKLKEFTGENLRINENGREVLQMIRKHCGKRKNCSLQAISLFPTVVSKDLSCRQVKTRPCLGKGLLFPYLLQHKKLLWTV